MAFLHNPRPKAGYVCGCEACCIQAAASAAKAETKPEYEVYTRRYYVVGTDIGSNAMGILSKDTQSITRHPNPWNNGYILHNTKVYPSRLAFLRDVGDALYSRKEVKAMLAVVHSHGVLRDLKVIKVTVYRKVKGK